MNDDTSRNKVLKLVPSVVKGPWIVERVVGGKPVIVGNKLPVSYTYYQHQHQQYQPAAANNIESGGGGGNQTYLEVDLDIVSSATARRILSIVKNYTRGLVLDLGFVIEGQQEDELPEQMLGAIRFHGIDPITAPHYPIMPVIHYSNNNNNDDIFDHPSSSILYTK